MQVTYGLQTLSTVTVQSCNIHTASLKAYTCHLSLSLVTVKSTVLTSSIHLLYSDMRLPSCEWRWEGWRQHSGRERASLVRWYEAAMFCSSFRTPETRHARVAGKK